MHRFIRELYPICRSITGNGLRETLRAVAAHIPLELHEVPTGTSAYDWTVPREWNIRDAYIANSRGKRVVDFRRSSLHVVSYSLPVRRRMRLAELRPHLHSLPEQPDWIPYRTSYYCESWGFCLRHRDLAALPDDLYEVCIDASLEPGALTYGECVLPGRSPRTVLLSCHACHPALCNDNLSGVALVTWLGKRLADADRRYSYRLLFLPGTIGAITWLSRNASRLGEIAHGLVVACVGDPGPFHYKRSRRGDAEIDRAAVQALAEAGGPCQVRDFSPAGYDERQYCSPGFDLPVGSLTRTPHGRFPEYHTSADDLSLVRPSALAGSLSLYRRVFGILEGNRRYRNLSPWGEPQLGRRGLYAERGGHRPTPAVEQALLWVLNLSDGRHDLLEVCRRSGLAFDAVVRAADALCRADLLEPLDEQGDVA